MQNKLKETLKKLVRLKTVTDDTSTNKKALSWVARNLPREIKKTFHESKGHASLIVTTKRTKKPKVWLAAHMDVVPAPPSMFIPKERGHRLIGRGTFDMKFAIACYMMLFKDFAKDIKNLDAGIMISTDEEAGGSEGVPKLLNKGYASKIAFLPDVGEPLVIEAGAKGVWQIKAEARGLSAHGSRPWEGENAILKLVDFIKELEKVLAPKQHKNGGDYYHNTVSVGKINGGNKINQVPNFAEALIDIRFIPETGLGKLKKVVRDIAAKNGVDVKLFMSMKPRRENVNLPEFRLFRDIYKEKSGVSLGNNFSNGSSDARFFKEKKIPVLMVQPQGGNPHSENEWIDTKSLAVYYEVLKKWVKKVAYSG